MLFWYSEVCIEGEFRVHRACHDPESLIFCDSLLKEVGFPLQGNGLHEVKWIFCIVHLIEGQKQCQKRQKACNHCTTSNKTTLASPRSARRRSATNSMYCFIRQQFIPIKSTDKASVRNSCNQKHVIFAPLDQDFPVWSVHVHGKVALTDLLNANGFSDDVLYSVLRRLFHQVAVEQARKCTVQALKNSIYAITIGLTPHN